MEDLKKEDVQAVTPTDTEQALSEMKGAFVGTLTRNNKKIKADRALDIVERAQMKYKREIEDMALKIKTLKRRRDGKMDLSPTTADSLTLGNDFNETDFVADDIKTSIEIRNEEIRLELAVARYEFLFGEKLLTH